MLIRFKKRRAAKPGDKRSVRGMLCRQIMLEQGFKSLMEASHFIKIARLKP